MKKLITTITCSIALSFGAWAQICVEKVQPDTLWMIPNDIDLKGTICVNIDNKTYEGCKFEMVDGKIISIYFNKRGQEIQLSDGMTTELGLTCRKDGEEEKIGFVRGCNMSLITRRQIKSSNGEYYNSHEYTAEYDNHANISSEIYYRFNENGDTIECHICKNVYDKRYPCFQPVRKDEYTNDDIQGEYHIVVTREYDDFENMTLEEVYINDRLSEKTTLTIERDHKSRELKRKYIKTDYAIDEWQTEDIVQSQTITTTYDDTTDSSFSIEEWKNKRVWTGDGWLNNVDTYSTTYTCQDSIVTENYNRHHEYTNGESVYSWVLAEHLVTDRNNKMIRKLTYDGQNTCVYNYLAEGRSAEMTQYDKEGNVTCKFDIKYNENGTTTITYAELNGKWVKCGEEFMSQDACSDQWHLKFGTKIFTNYTLINGQYREVAKFMYDNREKDHSYKMTNGEWKLYQESDWLGGKLKYDAYYRILGQDTLIIKNDAVYKDGNWTTDYRYRQESDGKLNDHAYVDLGLSSGTLWATANIGATHFYDKGCDFSIEEAKRDVAKATWGKEWSIPTPDDWIELINECQWTPLMKEWIGIEDEDQWVYGAMVTGPNGKTIFLPLQYSGECRNMYLWATDGYCCNYQNYYLQGHMPKIEKADWALGIRPIAKKK